MIEVKFRLGKRDFVWLGLIVVLLGLGGVYAYNSGLDPSIMGHSSEEIVIDDALCKKITGHKCGYDVDTANTPSINYAACSNLFWPAGGTCPANYVLVGAAGRYSDSGEWNYFTCCRLK